VASSWDENNTERPHPWADVLIGTASLLIAFWAFPSHQNLVTQVEEFSPVRAVEFIKAHGIAGPMLNDWVDGGYLVWAAPEHPDFIDGRADPFDQTGVTGEFAQWATLQTAPNILLDKYHINFCLLRRDAPMAVVLQLLPNWKSVYSDNISVIFVRVSPATPLT
jgi:hypothetical protein